MFLNERFESVSVRTRHYLDLPGVTGRGGHLQARERVVITNNRERRCLA